MERGLIFDIERYSTADGPGIRTVVFFKGCNLHCYWCHNPESLKVFPEVDRYEQECIHCGRCVQVCPEKCHVFTETGRVFHSEKCIHCMACTEACPVAALRPIGKWLSVEDCMAQIREDVVFYGKSGGGVTLSGGEVLMQKAFAQALLQRCHAEGIHTAIESNLCVDTAVLEQLIPQLDLVMADIKSMDAPAHIRGTGCSNEKTLRNIRWLDSRNVPLIIRTPVIPGFNDSEDNIAQTAEFLKSLSNLSYYELLSYNPMGNDKRKRLGYPVPEITALPAADITPAAQQGSAAGAEVLVQGIADLVLVFDEHAEILDYKTDRSRDAQYYIDEYAAQLRLYRRAFAQRLSVPVTKLTIYSFAIGDEIDVPLA